MKRQINIPVVPRLPVEIPPPRYLSVATILILYPDLDLDKLDRHADGKYNALEVLDLASITKPIEKTDVLPEYVIEDGVRYDKADLVTQQTHVKRDALTKLAQTDEILFVHWQWGDSRYVNYYNVDSVLEYKGKHPSRQQTYAAKPESVTKDGKVYYCAEHFYKLYEYRTQTLNELFSQHKLIAIRHLNRNYFDPASVEAYRASRQKQRNTK